MMAYSVYISSTLGFLVQLDGLPPQWPQVEREALRRLVSGSILWTSPEDLHELDHWGLPACFR